MIVDVVGACAVLCCLGGFVWLTMIRTNVASQELNTSRRKMQTLQRQKIAVHNSITAQTKAIGATRDELAESGSLPAVARVEDYFQFLSTTARNRNLRVLRHLPLSSRDYAGLLEQRYTFDVSGPTPNILAFLADIEESKYWADVSYLKIYRNIDQSVAGSDRVASLTISMYSNPVGSTGTGHGV